MTIIYLFPASLPSIFFHTLPFPSWSFLKRNINHLYNLPFKIDHLCLNWDSWLPCSGAVLSKTQLLIDRLIITGVLCPSLCNSLVPLKPPWATWTSAWAFLKWGTTEVDRWAIAQFLIVTDFKRTHTTFSSTLGNVKAWEGFSNIKKDCRGDADKADPLCLN